MRTINTIDTDVSFHFPSHIIILSIEETISLKYRVDLPVPVISFSDILLFLQQSRRQTFCKFSNILCVVLPMYED